MTVTKCIAELGFTAQARVEKGEDFVVYFYDEEVYILVSGTIGKKLWDPGLEALSIYGHFFA